MRIRLNRRLAAASGAAFVACVAVALAVVWAMPGGSGAPAENSSGPSASDSAHVAAAPSPTALQPTPGPSTAAGPSAATATPGTHTNPSTGGSAPAVPAPAAAGAAMTSGGAPPPAAPAARAASADQAGFEAQYCATKLDAKGRSQCGSAVSFCDTWAGGFCNDYRYIQLAPGQERPFGSDPRDDVSVDCLSSTNVSQLAGYPYYLPTNMSEWTDLPVAEVIPFPCAFGSMEHFMTRIEDGQFGMVIMRQQRPFDFAGRTGHIHFDLDMKTAARRYFRVVLSPQLTKVATDDRQQQLVRGAPSLELWFVNGQFVGHLLRADGTKEDAIPFCNGCGPRYYGVDNVRDSLDIYVSRTHVRIDVNGKTYVDNDMPDLGFDRAYLYLEHLNYNSCKGYAIEGFVGPEECTVDGNMFHWDNVAFDGPLLPRNALTPVGSEDVVFNAYGQTSCTVKGVPAATVDDNGPGEALWSTWVARLPANTPVSAGDVTCAGNSTYRGVPMGLEVVRQ